MAKPTNPASAPRPVKQGTGHAAKPKKAGGGIAAAGGTNFQAVVTAVAAVHLLSGTPLGWWEGLTDDTPIGIWTESEGPGDDVRIELAGDRVAEVQAKKGLTKGPALWDALDALAQAIANGTLDFGLLAVGPDSSATIRRQLAQDIERIGQGREDRLTDIGQEWLARLRGAGLDSGLVCSRLRIRVVHGLVADDADTKAARALLRTVCANPGQAHEAWNVLVVDAHAMMQQRGRGDLPRLIRLLAAHGIAIGAADSAAGISVRIAKWAASKHDSFTLSAARKRLPLTALLPMRVVQIPFEMPAAEDAQKALARYHDGSMGRSRDDAEYYAEWTGRFRRLAVIQAGPGLGKSTLATKLAHEFASDGFVVLHAPLKQVAAAMARGENFDAALSRIALDGSDVPVAAFESARLADIAVITDGLDDCGAEHEVVAAAIHAYAIGHPHARIIVTTRTIGYSTTRLSQWQHYRLIAPSSSDDAWHLGNLLQALADDPAQGDPHDLARTQLRRVKSAKAISVNPLTLSMAASLLHRRGQLPETKSKLYEELIGLFERDSQVDRPANVSASVAAYVLNALGWAVVDDPLVPRMALVARCSDDLALALDRTKLAASSLVEAALAYWENTGLIEAVHHDGLALLTFVHKTFAEFAAARRVAELEAPARNRELARIIELPDWAEVVTFASGMGLGNDIARLFLAGETPGDKHRVERALELAIDADAQVDDAVAQDLAKMALGATASGDPQRYAIGLSLVRLAERRPNVIGPQMAEPRGAQDFATRLAAWAVSVAAGADYYEPADLEAAFEDLLPQVESRFSKGGLFSLKAHDDQTLIGQIGVAALEAQPVNAMERFAERHLLHEAFDNTKIQSRIAAILAAQGLTFSPVREAHASSRSIFDRFLNPPEEECRVHNQALRALAAAVAIEDADAQPQPSYPTERYLQFAGYQSLSCFRQASHGDLQTWSQPYDEAAVASTMKAMVATSTLDLSALGAEARQVVRFLDANPLAKPFDLHFPEVDIPPPEWSRAAALPLDWAQVEVALRHGSEWLAYVAGNLFEAAPYPEHTDDTRLAA